jgi:hypothetical protein
VVSDAVNLAHAEGALFSVYKGVGTTGTATITVESCSAADGTGATAIPFKYSRQNNSADTAGALTAATTSGFTTTAGSSEMYQVDVKAADCADGKPWVRLKSVEVVDSPIVGAITIALYDLRRAGQPDKHPTVIA